MIGWVLFLFVGYLSTRHKKTDKQNKTIRVFTRQTKIPMRLKASTFNLLFGWFSVTTLLLVYQYYAYLFSLDRMDRQLAIPVYFLVGMVEVGLTICAYFVLTEVYQTLFFVQLLERKTTQMQVFDKIERLLNQEQVAVPRKQLSQMDRRCIRAGVFGMAGLDKLKHSQLEDTIELELTPAAQKFYSNQEAILAEGITLGE